MALFFQFGQNVIHGFLRISETHHAVFVEEQWVLYTCVAGIHRAFEDDDFFCLPHFQHGHTRNRAVRVGLPSRATVAGVQATRVSPDNDSRGIPIFISESFFG